jgi:hypothetical protein
MTRFPGKTPDEKQRRPGTVEVLLHNTVVYNNCCHLYNGNFFPNY